MDLDDLYDKKTGDAQIKRSKPPPQ